ncbi:AAA family ATPase [Streptomyces nigrescens]|uniref:AAA family ATPase n=2 Tax=Streptomyces nigrescens TaxID=1920 RepID=A0ABY7IPI5_STRNI|nr:AAA family ATPase [Streptomyces libani]WAU00809.1 AAA family ATPase [Streptomyces libani subsp. libani]
MSTSPSDRLPMDPAAARELFVARLRAELHPDEERPQEVSDARRAYREAACLLSRFDPQRLRLPGEEAATGGAVLELVDDCTTMGMQDQGGWSLKSDVRERTLRGLAGPEAARRVLECHLDQLPAEPGPERFCLAYLSGRPPATDGLTTDELADALQAVLWLSRVPGTTGLPDTAELQLTLERARLLDPLERLVRWPFQGRTRELAELRDYVLRPGGSPAAGAPPDGHPQRPALVPPLVVHGPGGMGKTTLLAKFVLDSIHDPGGCFPFAYIDFERPTLSIQEPVTLIAEAARQLGIQFPAHRAELDALAHECQQAARSQREGQERVTQLHELATTRAVLGRRSSQEFQSLAAGRETDLIRRLADVLRRAVADRKDGEHPEDPPFALVVDSFEEAQYRGSPVVGRMVAIYLSFQSIYPRMRLIVSGRAPVEHPAKPVESLDIELGELDAEAAVGLLTSCGVKDPEVARALTDRVGGHPLSLKLAARAATLAGLDAEGTCELIRSLPERRHQVFRRVDQLLVQGILYERILSHIGNEEVRRLAHPGLVLRVITPEIIQEVLAGPCGLHVAAPDQARALFEELRRLDMVEPVRPDAVRYRSDVRAIMLRLPGGDRTAVMRAVERRAVEHYATRDGLEARAEEIYHRLRLDENPRSVEERWLPGVERFLVGAQQDMTPRAAGLLTARLGGGTPDQVAAGADQEDWERIAAREVEDLLSQGYAQAAFERLGRRQPWTPCSPLHALLAEALNRLGRREEARRATADAIDATERAGCGERRLELLLLSARLSEEAGDVASAGRALRVAEDVAVGLGQDLEAMGALLARARLTAGADGADPEADQQLAERLRRLPDAVLADQPVLVRAVASQIYDQAPGALDHALEVVGLPADDETLDTLGAAMRRATSRQPALLGRVMGILDEAAGPSRQPAGGAPTGITGILRLARDRGTLGTLARRLLAVPDKSGEIVAGVAAAMGVGTGARSAAHAASGPERENRTPEEGSGPAGPDDR